MSDVCFISYSRRDQAFVRRLAAAMQEHGRTPWVDWRDIPPSSRWLDEVRRGIEDAQAFVFVLSAASLDSQTCALELSHAVLHNKRLVVPVAADPGPAEVSEALAAVQWVAFDAALSFDAAVNLVIAAIDVDLPWVRQHTRLLRLALDWVSRGEPTEALLRGGQLVEAEAWLAEGGAKEPAPTEAHRRFIAASRRAEDLATAMESVMAADALVVQGRAIEVDDAYERAIATCRRYSEEPLAAIVGLWRLYLARPLVARRLGDAAAPVKALTWHDRGLELIAVHEDGQVKVWAAGSGKQLGGWEGSTPVTAAAVGETLLATADADGAVRLSDIATGSQAGAWPTGRGRIWALAMSSDERTLVLGGADGSLEVRALPDGAVRHQLDGHATPLMALALSADGSLLVSASIGLEAMESEEGKSALNLAYWRREDVQPTLRLWSLQQGRLLHDFSGWTSAVSGLALFDNDRTLATAVYDQFTGAGLGLRVWDVASGRRIGGFAEDGPTFFGLSLTADATLALTDEMDSATVWGMQSGRRRRTLPAPEGLHDPKLAPAGDRAAAGDERGRVQLWNIGDEPVLRTLAASDSAVKAVALSPDGTLLLSGEGLRLEEVFAVGPMIQQVRGDRSFPVRLWDLATGWPLLELTGHAESVGAAAFLSDAVAVSGDFKGKIYLWDLATGTALGVLKGDDAPVVSLAVQPGGRGLASGDLDGAVHVWQLPDGSRTTTFNEHEGQVSALAWLPGGQEIASGSADGTVRIWDARTGRTRLVVDTGPDGTRSLAITPDGDWLVTGGWDRGIHVFDLRTGMRRRSLYGHAGRVTVIALSPSGRFIVSGSEDATLRIWDLEQNRQHAVLEGHARDIESVAFAPDGTAVVSSSSDGTMRVWDFGRAVSITQARDVPEPARLALMGEWSAALGHPQSDDLPLEARAECELGAGNMLAARRTVSEVARAQPSGLRWPLMARALNDDALDEARDAAEWGDIEELEALLAEQPWLASWGAGGSTLLHRAAASADVGTIAFLLGHGSDVHARTPDGWTPLHEAIANSLDVARQLLAASADPSAASFEGYTPLQRAAVMGATDHARLLLDNGADLESADSHGLRALHFAASQGQEQTARLLMERGADVSAPDSEGHTAAETAERNGHQGLAAQLRPEGPAARQDRD